MKTIPVARHEAEVRNRFDRLHARFKVDVATDDFRLDALRRALGALQSGMILDVGCGKGRFAARLAEGGARVVGIDLSSAMLAEARGPRRVRASALRLPFRDATFDAVAAVEVFEHLPVSGHRVALAEARRVLRPDGLIAVLDKNAWSLNAVRPWLPNLLLKWIDTRRGRWMYPGNGPVRERWFRPAALAGALSESGFEDVRIAYLLGKDEARSPVFHWFPQTRLMTLWTARTTDLQGGDLG